MFQGLLLSRKYASVKSRSAEQAPPLGIVNTSSGVSSRQRSPSSAAFIPVEKSAQRRILSFAFTTPTIGAAHWNDGMGAKTPGPQDTLAPSPIDVGRYRTFWAEDRLNAFHQLYGILVLGSATDIVFESGRERFHKCIRGLLGHCQNISVGKLLRIISSIQSAPNMVMSGFAT